MTKLDYYDSEIGRAIVQATDPQVVWALGLIRDHTNIKTLREVQQRSDAALLRIPGLGPKLLVKVREATGRKERTKRVPCPHCDGLGYTEEPLRATN